MKVTRDEKKCRLKYFYFINPDDVLKTIIQSSDFLSYVEESPNSPTFNDSLTNLMDNIFEIILKASLPYTSYLDLGNTLNSFFGESTISAAEITDVSPRSKSSYTFGAISLMKIALLHQLIIETFFTYIKEDELLNHTTISFTTKYDNYFDYGCFELKSLILAGEISTENEEEYDKRVTYKKRYDRFIQAPENHYSKIILNSFTRKEPSHRKNQKEFLTIPIYLHQFAGFIYPNREVHYLDKAIHEANPIEKKYDSLYEKYLKKISILNRGTDKLVFSFPMEKAYGFSTMYPIKNLLHRIYTSPISDEARTYRDLDDQKFCDIIKQFFRSPFVYSRAFFLQYACDAIIYGDLSSSRYLVENIDTFGKRILPNDQSKISRVSYGLTLLEKYIMNLNQLVFPLLKDLWDVVLDDINDQISNDCLKITLDTINCYINKNYRCITADFTRLSYDDIASCYCGTMNASRKKLERIVSSISLHSPLPKQLPRQMQYRYEGLLRALFSQKYSPSSQYNNNTFIYSDSLCGIPSADVPKNARETSIYKIRLEHARVLDTIATSPSLLEREIGTIDP